MLKKLLHGVRVPHHKNTADCEPVRMTIPAKVVIPMSMHIGAPAKPVVKLKDTIAVGQMIGEVGGFVSAPVHSGVSGVVKKIDSYRMSNGKSCQAVTIETDGLQTICEELKTPEINDFDSFIAAVRDSGAVGLGGAGFPTAVKLKVDPAKVEYICINGAECEPYITSDTRTMTDQADKLAEGVALLRRFFSTAEIIFGIENNKPQCIEKLRSVTNGLEKVTVKALPALYPQGGEKVLIFHTTGRIVPEGKLPIDVGCIVMNPTTLVTVVRYIQTGMPLVEKCVTVDGSAVEHPMNVIVPIGTSIGDLVAFTGGFKGEPAKLLYGGPMMGMAVPDAENVILKNTNAILCLNEEDAVMPEPTACIRCGSCIDACPLNLMPVEMEEAFERKDGARLKKLKVNLCMECGCCAYVCPAKRRLVESHKLAKEVLNTYNQAQKVAEEKKAAKALKEGEARS